MTFFDVTAEVPLLHAGTSVYPVGRAFDAGLNADLELHRASHASVALRIGASLLVQGSSTWSNIWDVPVEGGWRWTAPSHGYAVPFWELLGGPHLVIIAAELLPPLVTATVGTHTGFGVTLGKGKVGGVLAVRAGIRFGGEDIIARTNVGGQEYGVYWAPWAGWLAVSAGVSFR